MRCENRPLHARLIVAEQQRRIPYKRHFGAMIETPTPTRLKSFPIEKLDAHSGAFVRIIARFNVGDPAGEDSFGCSYSRDSFWHSQKHVNRQPYKYRMPGHKEHSPRRYIYGFRLVTIFQWSVNRAKNQRNFQPIAV
jgi:hypothetical protein